MFMPIKFNTTVQLTPRELTDKYEDVIMNKVKNSLENVCSKHGFIKKSTIKIIKRSAGYFKEHHFNGNIAFDLNCIAEICNPAQDSIIKCIVKGKNKSGLRAEGMYDDLAILEVMIPKITSGIQSEVNIDSINIGDEIKVQVCGKKFTLYDKMISIVGKVIKDKDESIVVVQQQNEEEELLVDEEIEADDILTDAGDIIHEEDEDEEGSVKKLDIIEATDSKIGGDLEDEEDIEEADEDEFEEEEEFEDEEDYLEDLDYGVDEGFIFDE